MPAKHFLLSVFVFFSVSANIFAQQKKAAEDDFDRGYRFLYNQVLDSAYYLLNNYINTGKDSLKKGMAYLYMGEMLWKLGDPYGAQELLLKSATTLNEKNERHKAYLGYTFNVLGNLSLDLRHYDEAIGFYDKALAFSPEEYQAEQINGKALAFRKKGDFAKAIALYDLLAKRAHKNKLLVARITDNRAFTKWLSNPKYSAADELHSSLKMRADSQDTYGMNASYAHLSDYYESLNPDSSLWYATKMWEVATKNQSPDDVLEALGKLMLLSRDATIKDKWFKSFKNLSDSLTFSRDTSRNRFALIKYEIPSIKAANKQLTRQVSNQKGWIYRLIVFALVAITVTYTWYYFRKQRIERESRHAIRDAKLKTSQKVHDVVANGLYNIMNELEHKETIDREPIITRIEDLYEKSRNISYEDFTSDNNNGYETQVHNLLNAFATDQTRVFIVGNQPQFWNKLSAHQKQELQLVLNELMVNMKKHSHAKNVSLQFKGEHNKTIITYKDDGIGFGDGLQQGNGLASTVNRINALGGDIIFGKRETGGLQVEIGLPFQSSHT